MPPNSRKRLDLDPPTSGRPPKPPSAKPPPFKRLNIEMAKDGDDLADSGPRHTRTRGVSASVRRERSEKLKCVQAVVEGVEDEDDQPWDMGAYSGSSESGHEVVGPEVGQSSQGEVVMSVEDIDDILRVDIGERVAGDEDEDEDEDEVSAGASVHVRKGKGGRFVGSKGSASKGSKSSKKDDSWIVKGRMGGGPCDGTLIPSYGGHVAVDIWEGRERMVLKCHDRVHTHKDLIKWREQKMDSELILALSKTRLDHLPYVAYGHIDAPLISAFVERWQPDTNTFHMPFGEMTITLHDVWHILRIPIEGRMLEPVGVNANLPEICMEILHMKEDQFYKKPSPVSRKGSVSYDDVYCRVGCVDGRAANAVLKGYLFSLLSSTLFTDKSGNRLMAHILYEIETDLGRVGEYSWGSAALAYLYRQLGMASRAECAGIAGFLTLLQAWIYEYFPCLRPRQDSLVIGDNDARCSRWDFGQSSRDHQRLISFRSRLDQMTAGEVLWLPFGPDPELTVPMTVYMGRIAFRGIVETYNPERVLRQFGRIQGVPPVPDLLLKSHRPRNPRGYDVSWLLKGLARSWEKYMVALGYNTSSHGRLDDLELADLGPNWCVEGYIDWFYKSSHPILVREGSGGSQLVGNLRTHTDYWMNRCIETMQGLMIEVGDESSQYSLEAKAIISDWEDLLS